MGINMSHVPTWVWVLFAILVYIGIKRCFTSTVKVKQLLLLPIGLLYLSFNNLYAIVQQHPSLLLIWILGFVGMAVVGAYYVRNVKIKANKHTGMIEIPGDCSVLIIILLIFCVQFFFHYAIGAGFHYASDISFLALMVFFSGMSSGFVIGRNGMYVIKYMK
jgi:hypothetical protein